jgi:hypothetical protein
VIWVVLVFRSSYPSPGPQLTPFGGTCIVAGSHSPRSLCHPHSPAAPISESLYCARWPWHPLWGSGQVLVLASLFRPPPPSLAAVSTTVCLVGQCAMPDVGFKSKWFFVEGLPVAAVGMFILFHILQVLKKRVVLGRTKKLNSHLPSLVGTTFVMM